MANRNNVLLFIDWFLPGTASGGPVRSIANMIQQMEDIAFFYIITRDKDYVSNIAYNDIKYGEWNSLFKNAKVFYLSEKDINLKTYNKLIKEVNFESAYINGIYSPKFSILPLIALRKENTRIIVGARGMLNPQAFSVKRFKKKLFLSIAKITRLYTGVVFHATNRDEQTYIQNLLGKDKKVVVAPNFPRKIEDNFTITKKHSGELKLVNIARISKEKGTMHMFRYIKELKGKVVLDIYGPIYDQSYWEQCLNTIKNLPKNISVSYKGAVSGDEIPNKLQQYHFFIMPSEGENFGHSIVEALSAGLPVIISNLTPWKNLEQIQVGWDIPIENEKAFKTALETALNMDNNNYSKWASAAYEYALDIINDENVLMNNKKMLFG